ncbi:cytochrome P450 [Mycena metata]|uniref:Cytochrome P450 n=1 Tax=Mycena metata TaxID=1033252 RepID=A0AAD7HX00_9AGAR|nr:cytochrome P450 [Mycena metata]
MTPVTAICALIAIFYVIRILRRRSSSTLDNIPGPPPTSFITGNLTEYHDADGWDFQQKLEQDYGRIVRFQGLLGARVLFVFDPTAMQSILVKDQNIYEESKETLTMNSLLFGPCILSTEGEHHRKFRKTMIPAFSTANLRRMVPTFYEVVQRARDGLIQPFIRDGPQELDLNNILCRTSLELIGQTGIGYSFDPMLPGKERTDQYARALKGLLPAAFKLGIWLPLLPAILKIPSRAFLRLMISVLPLPALRETRDLVDFMAANALKLVQERKEAIRNGTVEVKDDAKDIMSLLSVFSDIHLSSAEFHSVKGNMANEKALHLTDEELVASTSIIIFAATDTTSSSLNRLLHIIAQNPDIQDKLRAEILSYPETMDHDTIVGLPYLDAVIRETMRLYPPVTPAITRQAVEDTVMPLSKPVTGVDGTIMDTIKVPKGTICYVAIGASNHDKQVWGEDALEFRPERWVNGKAESVTTKLCGVYGNTMTFIGGGRSCIGFKFSQLEMKVVLCVLLRAFKFSQPDPRIKWLKGDPIQSPHVDNEPRLPIVVERLKI